MQKRKICDKCNKLISFEEKNGILFEVCDCGKNRFVEK